MIKPFKLLVISALMLVFAIAVSGCGSDRETVVNRAESCTAEQSKDGVIVSCPGSDDQLIPSGEDGEDGTSCTVSNDPGGATINCSDGSSVFLPEGEDGTFQGQLEYVTPCPSIGQGNKHREVLVNLDGVFMAFLTAPNHMDQRLTIIPEGGPYQTTDDRNVLFKIEQGELVCLADS